MAQVYMLFKLKHNYTILTTELMTIHTFYIHVQPSKAGRLFLNLNWVSKAGTVT